MVYFVCYTLPTQWFATHADPWPEDIQNRSYFMDGICGEGTGRLYPDPNLPNMTNDSYVAYDEEGNYYLVYSDGTRLLLIAPEGFEFPKIIPYTAVPDDYEHAYTSP